MLPAKASATPTAMGASRLRKPRRKAASAPRKKTVPPTHTEAMESSQLAQAKIRYKSGSLCTESPK